MLAAQRAEEEATDQKERAEEVAKQAGKAAAAAEERGGVIPGIGYVGPKKYGGIMSEIFNPVEVPVSMARREEEGEQASLVPPRLG